MVGTHDGGIHIMDLSVQLAGGIGLGLERFVDLVPDALLLRVIVAGRDDGALAIAGGEVLPGHAGAQDPEDAVDCLANIGARPVYPCPGVGVGAGAGAAPIVPSPLLAPGSILSSADTPSTNGYLRSLL
jgi:hypothetical protein